MRLPEERVGYSPIVVRPPIQWPNGKRLAVWVSPNIEHYELMPPDTAADRSPWPRVPAPDVQQYSYRDYGNRVGLWRMAEICGAYEIPCTVSLNLGVLDHFPEIADLIRSQAWSIMSHGIYNTRYLTGMPMDEERQWLLDTVDTVRRHMGTELLGMLGPAISSTVNTPDLMAELGLIYHADWAHDDQPVPIRTNAGKLVSIPYSFELNDGPVFAAHYDGGYFADICKRQFDVLYEEGAANGRVMCIALHPFLIGQPHMASHLRDIFRHISSREDVWLTTGDDIAKHYIDNFYDAELAFVASIASTDAHRRDRSHAR